MKSNYIMLRSLDSLLLKKTSDCILLVVQGYQEIQRDSSYAILFVIHANHVLQLA